MKRYSWIIFILVLVLTPRLWADDTDIYGTTAITVTPNVLIIFDTSGSMGTADVIGEYYDPNTTYDGSYTANAVYRWKDHQYQWFADDIEDLNCPSVKAALLANGHERDNIYSSWGDYACGGKRKSLYLGNWLNYDASGVGDPEIRREVAKEVIKQLITTTENVNFGLMRFNDNQGGRLLAPCGTDKATLLSIVDALPSSGYTPLAETLAEAGLYFAGKKSWFNNGSGYSSDCDIFGNGCFEYSTPMTARCQKNYIILMTDGEPTYDQDSKLASGTYINGDTIGDYDSDGIDPGSYGMYGSDYLDDVAKYLYDNDLNPNLGTVGESFEKQNIGVYTIGFKTEQQLLSDTAQNGGGLYYTANSISGLSAAFSEILADIADVSAVFVSPVVPVSRMNRTFAGNNLYVGFFKPREDGKWSGNIKKYGIDYHGNIIDSQGVAATLDNGEIKENSRSYWSDSVDGGDVLLGGLGGVLQDQTAESRVLYTYISGTGMTDFSKTNSVITTDVLDVESTTEKDSVIDDIRGVGKTWKLGDILHSRPSVVHYDTNGDGSLNDAFIFAGSNDGIMHCFKDSDGSETWGFIPTNLLPRLQELSDGTTTHKYFVDGVPKVYEGNNKKILFFGERRGGNHYYALNVTTYNLPTFLYSIDSTFLVDEDGNGDLVLDDTNATLGQSWFEPTVHTIKTSSGLSDKETVFLLAGGYDENQDKPLPADPGDIQPEERATTDTVGRAVFTINAETGAISKLNVNAGFYSDMTHSIVNVSGFDANGNGITNRVYAGDLGGNVFAFEDDDGNGTWSRRKLFSAPVETSTARRKIFYAPDGVEETFGEMIFFGTGDRADPEGTGVVNRIYAVKNGWEDPATTLTESDLYDATLDLIVLGSLTEQAEARTKLGEKDGWFIKLDQYAGEKVTSPMVVYDGVVWFTTYTPESGPPPDPDADPCEVVSGRGVARLYALNYKTGEAAFEWSDITETDGTDEHNVVPKGRYDRSKIIGTSIASAPVIAILEGGPQIYIGVEGGVQKEDPKSTKLMETFFWRQMNN